MLPKYSPINASNVLPPSSGIRGIVLESPILRERVAARTSASDRFVAPPIILTMPIGPITEALENWEILNKIMAVRIIPSGIIMYLENNARPRKKIARITMRMIDL